MRVLAVALTAVLILVSVAAIVGAFALLARRLLGLRFGLVRLLLAGLVGFAVAGPIAQAMAGSVRSGGAATPLWFLLLAGAAALVVAMVFLVVAEALVPSGSLPGPLELRRALRGRAARTRRYSQISRIAVRHGLGPYLWGRRGRAELDTPGGRERLARSLPHPLGPGDRRPGAGRRLRRRGPRGARLPHRGGQHGRGGGVGRRRGADPGPPPRAVRRAGPGHAAAARHPAGGGRGGHLRARPRPRRAGP
jgi:hypothetical protein